MRLLHQYNFLVDYLNERLKQPLPGLQAQLKLLPPYRSPDLPEKGYKKSSVCVLIKPVSNKPYIVMIERTEDGKVHSGQIAFPGGKMEENETIEQTALREMQEETGLPANETRIAGLLTPLYIPPSNFMVYPVIGLFGHEQGFMPNTSEVKRIVEIPLAAFFEPGIVDVNAKHRTQSGFVTSPAYLIDGVAIWGASAMILAEFLALFEKT